ncbi:thioredoxin [Clostridium botulinum]|uniref:Thioredoxin n=1 Tax=Clostridium botulinum C/D str. DC5 TaxID=1443128 RepID=A0A0A0IN35_CLOBO|nr:thioredoxin [Clostridium botulinum]KEI04987.1 thiol-disulfide isomerase [Clostridium botulinum C/D str. BKT75002]KEI11831.1 thiol-disulfide isomerase [Clostridium botulinum C/D str. BKT2873]KGM93955.1 thiol-disulfide isomerase [Clostridium botulinum D str. CCUG 7971]KGN00936.1 thiol-disulfide isomerase [Clostridium botulinum C/D str. DC5]KOC46392.1 thiol-disulfide isomerase [Clostridium botulinum]
MIKEIGQSNFTKEVINSEEAVVVDFWAPWCGPCKMLGPVMEELAHDMAHKAKFFKINIDENPEIAQKLQISSIPNVMVFKEGKVVENMVGFRPKKDFKEVLEKHI